MTTTVSKFLPIGVVPGVCPDTESTNADTEQFVAADKIRFVKGRAQKIGGWQSIIMNGTAITGCIRTIFSAQLDAKVQTVLGGSKGLYALFGSNLENITPLDETLPVAIANSLDTHYDTLANNPLHTTLDSVEVWVDDADAADYIAGDRVTLAGATNTGGILAAQFNKEHIVRAVGVGQIMIKTSTLATSTAAGGGNAVVRKSGLVTVNDTAHGLLNGERVGITGAVNFGGILAGEINQEFMVRGVQTDSFNVMTVGLATSSVAAGGGGATEYLHEIADGICDETNGQGYGMGLYGVGLYGTALLSALGRRYPRIWFADTFGDRILLTPGNGGKVYRWDGSLNNAPSVVPNAPEDVNYLFVSDNILVTFGADGVRNRIKASDINDIEEWSSSSVNQVFTDDIEGAGLLRSHLSLNGTNLIFTPTQCYTFRYIGLPFVWEIKFKDNIGIISPMARVVVNGTAYFMGQDNFYEWRGGNIEVSKSNVSNESTLLNYVFKNINRAQLSKCFAWHNKRFNEIWYHYPSEGSIEVDRIARYNLTDKTWTPDTMDRTAAEYPTTNLQFPRLISSANVFYRHEIGNDDDDMPLAWSLKTNLRDFGTDNVLEPQLTPDSVQSGDINVLIESFSYPQSPIAKNTKAVTIAPATQFVPLDVDGRFIQYTMSGAALGQAWIMGKWQESIQDSSRSE